MLRSSDRLKEYRQKRDFTRTPEPAPSSKRKTSSKLSYLIQKHDATRLHYDFRLEHNGALLSWAVPKGPSYNTVDKRLAVRTEDHPLEYGKFEGTIPKDEYGGGTVMLWDRGHWQPEGDVDEGLAKGKLAFRVFGERIKGKWAFVRLRSSKRDRGKENWLLIKERDDLAGPERRPVVERELHSVKTGRTMEEIARGRKVWHSNRPGRKASARETPEKPASRKSGGKKKKKGRTGGNLPLPKFVSPQLATLIDAPPPGDDWLHEIKYDGYRAVTVLAGGRAKIYTRNGLDWTEKFRPLLASLAELPCETALLDGEIAVADKQGHTNFGALQMALSEGAGGFGYYLFDLLHLDGNDLSRRPLIERKRRLQALLGGIRAGGPLFYSDHIEGHGERFFAEACELKLEGIISKRMDAPYRSGRAQGWLKSKCGMEQELVIIGWQPSDKAGRPFRSLLVAVNEEGSLRYAGRVGSGFDEQDLDELAAQLKRHARKESPAAGVPKEIARRARFVEPKLVGEFALRGWTRDNYVRQASFKGLRGDKPAREIVRERPMAKSTVKSKAKKGGPATRGKKTRGAKMNENGELEIAGVRITNPDRVLYPGQAITKRELIDYYLKIADRMLPHVAGRPLSLVRCPRGAGKECFFQKHASPGWPDEFRHVRIREKSGSDDYLYIDDEAGLVAATQMGVLELHIWGTQADDVERPDRIVFDLDPDEDISFARVKEAARDMRARLERLDLESFPMTTGGKGIHVVVPLTRGHSWDDHRNFAEALARLMAEEQPERYTAVMSKAKRRGKIFVDYLRNQRGATAIAPFSSRARKGAPVAWPVSWSQMARPDDAHPAGVEKQPRGAGDPWKGYFHVKQALPGTKLRR